MVVSPDLFTGVLILKLGGVDSLYRLVTDQRLNHRLRVTSGLRQRECAGMLQDFFVCAVRTKQISE